MGLSRLMFSGSLLDGARRGVPAAEDHASLPQSLAGLPAELGLDPHPLRIVVEGSEKPLKTPLRDEVYRIGREAIVNAYRHSQAKDIEIEIEFRRTRLRVIVRDNGCGIDPQKLEWNHRGWGLQRMRARAEKIGAQLRLLSRAALGTEVELCVPGRLAFD